MVQIPESVRPFAAAVAKYHFWILAALVPLILLPLVLMANGALAARIAGQRGVIDSKLGDVRNVVAADPHPNEEWVAAIDADTARIEGQTLAEWQRLWHVQQGLRVWPKLLDDDFIAAVTSLPPGGALPRPMLMRYKNRVPRLVRDLPKRMGAPDEMPETGPAQPAAEPTQPGREAAAGKRAAAYTWAAADQQKLLAAFEWTPVPSTTQVILAQEELWIYGMFCDIIAAFAKGATGSHDSPLAEVDRLAVGFPALPPAPGGPGARRLVVPTPDPADAAAGAPIEAAPPIELPPENVGEGAQAASPVHPRFGGLSRPPTDDDFRSWIYVDFNGRGLTAQQLAENPELKMVRLVPFELRLLIDQRQLDRFLAMLAAWPVPIDVRQVRINPEAAAAAAEQVVAVRDRPYDVKVELRGTVTLATRPEQPTQPAAEVTP